MRYTKIIGVLLAVGGLPGLLFAQYGGQVTASPSSRAPELASISEPPPPVVIKGREAGKLSEDELTEWLQSKVRETDMNDGEVKVLYIAPGYPLTLQFSEKSTQVVVGDSAMLRVDDLDRGLILSPTARSGDTSLTVFFSGQRRLLFHIFIAENFTAGLSNLRVSLSAGGMGTVPGGAFPRASQDAGSTARDGSVDVASIARIISNYDALLKEKSVDARAIRRVPLFQRDDSNGFEYYDMFLFAKSGTVVVTFKLTNRFTYPRQYDESKLRLNIGNNNYRPHYVSLNKRRLKQGESTTGFVVLADVPFSPNQAFELVWKRPSDLGQK